VVDYLTGRKRSWGIPSDCKRWGQR